MKFKYQAKTKTGEAQMGVVEAPDKETAAGILSSHDLFIVSLQQGDHVGILDRFSNIFVRIKREDMVIFTRQFSMLLEAQIPLGDALRDIYNQTSNQLLREAIYQLSEDISSGLSLSQALERQSAIFSEFFISIVRSAEVSGTLNEAMNFLADYTEKEAAIADKVLGALMYPMVIVGLFLGVAALMITVVFPQIGPIFEQSGVTLPWYTQILLKSGIFIAKWWFAVIIFIVVLVIMLIDYFTTSEGRALLDDMKLRLPIVSRIYLPISMVRFSLTLSTLLKGGVPVAESLEIVGHTIANVLYQDVLHSVSNRVREGEQLSEAMTKFPEYFPPLVSRMIAIGERTGRLEQILVKIAAFYTRESDSLIENLSTLIQPILLVMIGVLVGGLFASILLPIYQLTTHLGG